MLFVWVFAEDIFYASQRPSGSGCLHNLLHALGLVRAGNVLLALFSCSSRRIFHERCTSDFLSESHQNVIFDTARTW